MIDWSMYKKVMTVFVDEIKENMAIAIAQNGQITGQVGERSMQWRII